MAGLLVKNKDVVQFYYTEEEDVGAKLDKFTAFDVIAYCVTRRRTLPVAVTITKSR